MDLKKILGEKYKEDMTFEEIETALAEVELEGYVTVDEFNKVKKAKDEASKDASSWKKKYNSTLSEKERLNNEQKDANKELQTKYNELLKKQTVSEKKADLIEIGYDAKLAQETAEAMVDGDFAKVIENQSKFAESVKKNTTDELLKNTPEPKGGAGEEGMTVEKFKTLSVDEKQKLFETDPATFKTMAEGGK